MANTKIPPELVNKEIFNNRRLNINGGMDVAQRGTLTGLTSAYGGPDRYKISTSSLGFYSLAQSNDSPDGFANSLLLSCTTADASPSASDYAVLYYAFEGYDLQTLKFGTSDAEQVTVSFYVKTNKTGTYNLELYAPDNTSNPSANKQYTVSSANTWEKKTITFPCGNSAAIADDNTGGIYLQFWLGGGSTFTSGSASDGNFHSTTANRAAGNVNFADSTSNTFRITGVQVETGDVATPFEYRSYGEELTLCQRYYEKFYYGASAVNIAAHAYGNWNPIQPKRAQPSMSLSGNMTYYLSNGGNGTGGTAQTTSHREGSCAVRTYLLNATLVYFEGDMIAEAEI